MASDKIIDCLRHGACEGPNCLRGHTDVSLSEAGRQQVHSAAAKLTPPEIIFTSPLKRCLETAQHLSKQWGVEVRTLDTLREMNFGEWDGVDLAELYRQVPDTLAAFWNDPENVTPPGGEPLKDFRQRISHAWQEILAAKASHVLVMTHGGVIKMLMAQALGITHMPPRFHGSLKLDYSGLARFKASHDISTQSHWTVIEYFGPAEAAPNAHRVTQ